MMTYQIIGLVNYFGGPHCVDLGKVAVPEICKQHVLLSAQAVDICGSDLHSSLIKPNWLVWRKVFSLLASRKSDLRFVLNWESPLSELWEARAEMNPGKIVDGVLRPQ